MDIAAHLWSSIAYAETCPSCGDDPVYRAFMRPLAYCLADLDLIVRYDGLLDTLVTMFREDLLNSGT